MLFSRVRGGLLGLSKSSLKFDSASSLLKNKLFQSRVRFNSNLPDRTDKNLTSNSWSSRIPKFPFGRDIAPAIIPKANTPRVTKNFSFAQLMETLKNSRGPELLYMAESHRLYFITSLALTFVACYNLFDLADRSIKGLIQQYEENEEDLPERENVIRVAKRGSLALLFCSIYALTGFLFAAMPTRLVRRIEYLPGPKEHIRLVTHPWIPGRLSPTYTIPIENLRIGKRAKVWTGAGFYGTANRSSYFFFLFEKGHYIPWIVDRNGFFWGDGRVYDVLFGKEPVELAERGLSYDDVIRIQNNETSKKKAELRRQLGPAWQVKMAGKIMKEDAQKIREAARRAVLDSNKIQPSQDKPKHIGNGASEVADNSPPREDKAEKKDKI